MTKPPRRPPLEDIGAIYRHARHVAGLTQKQLAKKTKMREAQISLLENGHLVKSKFYWAITQALGYPSAMALLRARQEPETKKLLALWDDLETSERKRLLRKIESWL